MQGMGSAALFVREPRGHTLFVQEFNTSRLVLLIVFYLFIKANLDNFYNQLHQWYLCIRSGAWNDPLVAQTGKTQVWLVVNTMAKFNAKSEWAEILSIELNPATETIQLHSMSLSVLPIQLLRKMLSRNPSQS